MDENKIPLEVLVLEDDPKSVVLIEEALKEVAKDLVLRVVPTLEELQKALVIPEAPAPKPIYRLAILKSELFETTEQAGNLAANIKGFKAADATETQILMTSFAASEEILKTWSLGFVFNLIHQPFDVALLKQHLRLALNPEKPSSESSIHNMKTNASIEVLKAVPMESLSEVGFTTRSDRPVPLARITKFYGKVFGWKNLLSVFARSQEERPHPQNPKEWQLLMTYFGSTRDQLLQIRSRFPKKGEIAFDWRAKVPAKPVHFLSLGDPSTPGSDLAGTLTRTFPTAQVTSFPGMPDPKATLPPEITGIFLNKDLLASVEGDPRLKEIPRVLLATTTPTDSDLRLYSAKAIDLVTLPTERVAFFKRVSVLFPQLKAAEELEIKTYPWIESLDVGQPVELVEMSEAGMVIRYERALPIGTFRRIVLWIPLEAGLPVLLGRCYLTQPDASKPGQFIAYFVFFGMSDHEIKHVRLWMRDNYILAKSKNPT